MEKIRKQYYRHFWGIRADVGTPSDRDKKWWDRSDVGEERERG